LVENHQNYQEINERRVLPNRTRAHPLQLDRPINLTETKKATSGKYILYFRITKLQFVN
jgi:hypothetical protein